MPPQPDQHDQRPDQRFTVFCGLDVGKSAHHATALDPGGRRLVDRTVTNDEPDLRALLTDLTRHAGTAERVLVVVDQPASVGSLPVAVARAAGVTIAYLPGLTMRRLADLHPGQAKTDARDAYVIADAARSLPHTLRRVGHDDDTLTGLGVLIGYDHDLAAEATRLTNRLHDALLTIHPGLERILGPHLDRPGVLVLLQTAPTPAELVQLGEVGIAARLKEGNSPRLAATLPGQLLTVVATQTVLVPATSDYGRVIAGLARQLAGVRTERRTLAADMEKRLDAHPLPRS